MTEGNRMTPHRWEQLEQLYHSALEQDPEQRDAFIAKACASDPDLRRELESLVVHAADETRLDRPAWQGARVGPYEILEKLGAGGMGEVWKARDTRLGRIVAIKRSRSRFTERFEREARAVAALNHPRICTLYDIGPDYLVMEYVEGKPLEGPLPLSRALDYAFQILEALEAAHRAGIVHRDLKPANIMVNEQGVKLLDFGLARRLVPAFSVDETAVPTTPMTVEGVVLGTPQYMAPEQIGGRDVGAGTDIFAFGCVLYEMLVGERAFQGKTPASLAAAILNTEPPAVPAIQCSPVSRVLQTCLAKDPDQRWRSAQDVRHALRIATEDLPVLPSRRSRSWILGSAIAGAIGLLGAAILYQSAHLNQFDEPMQFALAAPPGTVNSGSASTQMAPPIVVSRDGRALASLEYDATGSSYIWVRRFDSVAPVRIDATLGARAVFWSPDGRHLGFTADRSLKRVSVVSGAVQTLSEYGGEYGGEHFGGAGSWSQDGTILFGGVKLYRVPAAGGTRELVAQPDNQAGETSYSFPEFLPDGQHYIYLVRHTNPDEDGIFLGQLGSPLKLFLVSAHNRASYAANGYLLFQHGRSLLAQRLDLAKGRLEGEAIPVANDLNSIDFGHSQDFSISQNGVLAYRRDPFENRGYWYDRNGARASAGSESGFVGVLISPDGARASHVLGNGLCVRDLRRGSLKCINISPTIVIGGAGSWSADSRRLIVPTRTGDKFEIRELNIDSGSTSVLYSGADRMHRPLLSGSGRFVIYGTGTADHLGTRVYLLPLTGERKPRLLFETRAHPDVSLSPDDRWLAVASNEFGRYEIYVAAIDAIANRIQVSTSGGVQPLWRADSRELFYLSPDGKMMSVDFAPGMPPRIGKPRSLFQTNIRPAYTPPLYCPTPDGKRFLLLESDQPDPSNLNVLLHWDANLRAR